jgi:hypothetical protein
LNIHQLAENSKKLEIQVREQEERIYKLESIITAAAWAFMPVGKNVT